MVVMGRGNLCDFANYTALARKVKGKRNGDAVGWDGMSDIGDAKDVRLAAAGPLQSRTACLRNAGKWSRMLPRAAKVSTSENVT